MGPASHREISSSILWTRTPTGPPFLSLPRQTLNMALFPSRWNTSVNLSNTVTWAPRTHRRRLCGCCWWHFYEHWSGYTLVPVPTFSLHDQKKGLNPCPKNCSLKLWMLTMVWISLSNITLNFLGSVEILLYSSSQLDIVSCIQFTSCLQSTLNYTLPFVFYFVFFFKSIFFILIWSNLSFKSPTSLHDQFHSFQK